MTDGLRDTGNGNPTEPSPPKPEPWHKRLVRLDPGWRITAWGGIERVR